MAVKANQPTLYDDIINLFEEAHKIDFKYVRNCDRFESIGKNASRIERRSINIISDPSELSTAEDWQDLQTVVEVINETKVKGKITTEKRYYISNLIDSAEKFGDRVSPSSALERQNA